MPMSIYIIVSVITNFFFAGKVTKFLRLHRGFILFLILSISFEIFDLSFCYLIDF